MKAPPPIRVLTVYQPWAWLIVHGWKDAENRARLFNLNGPLMIHAASHRGTRAEAEAMESARAIIDTLPEKERDLILGTMPSILPRGGIVGITWIDGDSRTMPEVTRSPWFKGPHAYHITEALPLAFEACRGAQGVWHYKGEMHRAAPEKLTGPRLTRAQKELALWPQPAQQ